MSQRTRPAPATDRPSPNHRYTDTSLLPDLQRHEPLTVEDRLDAEVLTAAAERGFTLAIRCLDCGHWLVNAKSVRLHRGPHCAARRAVPNERP